MSMCPVCSVAAVPKSTNYTDMRTAVGNSLNISANTVYRLDSKTLLLFSFGYSSFGSLLVWAEIINKISKLCNTIQDLAIHTYFEMI